MAEKEPYQMGKLFFSGPLAEGEGWKSNRYIYNDYKGNDYINNDVTI